MLVMTRKPGEAFQVEGSIVRVIEVRNGKVRLGILSGQEAQKWLTGAPRSDKDRESPTRSQNG